MSSEISVLSTRLHLPKRVKPFAEVNFNRAEFDAHWIYLVQSIENIFKRNTLQTNFENLYRTVESFHPEISVEVFNNLKQLCQRHVSEYAPKLYKDESTDEIFLRHVNDTWIEYCLKMELLRSIFLFADRKYWSNNPILMPFWDMSMQLWRDMYLNGPLVNKTISLCLKQIQNHRNGLESDRCLTQAIARMFIDLDLYSRFWEPRYLEEARSYYTKESGAKFRELSDTEYFAYVNTRLSEENERLEIYLSGDSIRIQFRDQLVNIILKPQLDELLKKGFNKMMDRKDTENLELVYNLTQLVYGGGKNNEISGVVCLRNYFKSYAMKSGMEIVENADEDPEKDKKMTQLLLDLKAYLDSVVKNCFKTDQSFSKTIRDCFESFLNARPNKPAEYLAKFLDSKLRSGNKNLTEEAMESIMDKVMILFRFITGKDVFEAFYLKDLAKRLLMGKSACVDTEKAMLEKLKQECGPNYTRKMETMFSDVETSTRLSKQFNESNYLLSVMDTISNGDIAYRGIEMNVNVICSSSWPTIGGSKQLIMPEYLLQLQEAFKKFYKANHNTRKLTFEPSLGTCIVRGYFPKGRKDLQVSEFQCMVLMQFNASGSINNDDVAFTYKQLETALGMEEDVLKKTLLSLSVGKGQRVLIKKPSATTVNDDDVFSFNENFHHKLTKIKFNQIQTKETKEEQQATEEQVFADRQAHLDCYIVRLMKSHRSIEHTQLVTEVLKELRFPLKGSDIKKRIEHLIERDYINRDSANPSLYHYVA